MAAKRDPKDLKTIHRLRRQGWSLQRIGERFGLTKQAIWNLLNRPGNKIPRLSVPQIQAWAQQHFERHGRWPGINLGEVEDAPGEKWLNINSALRQGFRGLPGGSSLKQVVGGSIPRLSMPQIQAWAQQHFDRHGKWPGINSGKVEDAPGEKWQAINSSLRHGFRGLPGGSSLKQVVDGLKNRAGRRRVRSSVAKRHLQTRERGSNRRLR